MHRDHKLGLALGVLVVGFAAALCFPKQTDFDQRLLQLENTADLDADIAQLPVHAYTNADLPVPTPGPVETSPPPEPPSVFGPTPLAEGEVAFDLLAGPPAPINPAQAPAAMSESGVLDHEIPSADAPELADTGGPGDLRAEKTTAGPVHYVVRPGDTLSSLAAVLLGNQSRYVELFEANREVLATPDDLRPGMVLVIPGIATDSELILPQDGPAGTQSAIPEVGTDAQRDTPAAAVAPTSAERPRLFRPVRSQSFLKTQPVSRETSAPLPTMDASDKRALDDAAGDQAETYTVRAGDTLEAIAVRMYGDARRVDELLKANRDTVRNPRRLRPGMKLNVPAVP